MHENETTPNEHSFNTNMEVEDNNKPLDVHSEYEDTLPNEVELEEDNKANGVEETTTDSK